MGGMERLETHNDGRMSCVREFFYFTDIYSKVSVPGQLYVCLSLYLVASLCVCHYSCLSIIFFLSLSVCLSLLSFYRSLSVCLFVSVAAFDVPLSVSLCLCFSRYTLLLCLFPFSCF